MSISIPTIMPSIYRRFILGRQGLWPGRRWQAVAGTAQALRECEAVQIDPVTVLAQSHDIVLSGRILDYQPAHRQQLLYSERKFFDYGGGLMIYPMQELPYWRMVMARRKNDKRWAAFAAAQPALIDAVRDAVRTRGPLRNRDLQGERVSHYRASKDSGVALYYLWLTGELMTHDRQGKERVYDFLENVAPAHLQHIAPVEEAEAYLLRKATSQLGFIKKNTFRAILKNVTERPIDARQASTQLAAMIEAEQLVAVQIEGEKAPHYLLASEYPALQLLMQNEIPQDWQPLETTTDEEVTFLSPLEYVSARGRAKEIFGFEYIWEIYKPAAKRQYGPYTMPILYGDRLVARMDAKAERQQGTLRINGLWLEPWFTADDSFKEALRNGVTRLTDFLELQHVDTEGLRDRTFF